MPAINETIDYNGYKIKRVIVDTTIVTDENTENNFPFFQWSPNNLPFTYFPQSVVRLIANDAEYVADSVGTEDVYDISLTFLNQHRSDGRSFEALVYYKEHNAKKTEIISMYGIKHGTAHQARLDGKIEELENPPQWLYADSINELHLFSTPGSAIIAGQFIPLQAPTNHDGWNDVTEMLESQTETQAMVAVLQKIDSGGVPKFPPGNVSSEIHAYMAQEEGGPQKFGTDFPGSLVFFEADLFPTAIVPWPVGYNPLDYYIPDEPMAGTYLGSAQATVDFVQNMGELTAPQPSLDDDDEYNMGYGVL